jgi:hypothetical protein
MSFIQHIDFMRKGRKQKFPPKRSSTESSFKSERDAMPNANLLAGNAMCAR